MQAIRKKQKRKNEDILAVPTHLPWFVGSAIGLTIGLLIGVIGAPQLMPGSNSISAVQSVCMTPDNSPSLGMASDVREYGQVIQEYLSAGGNTMQLKQNLLENGMLPKAALLTTGVIDQYDVSGDGINDVIVNLHYPDSQYPSTFALWVYVCNGSSYQQVYEDIFPGVSPVLDLGLYVEDVRDLNADLRPEIVYHSGSCGVNTCSIGLNVLTWDTSAVSMSKILSTVYPMGTFHLWDTDNDGLVEVVIQRGVYGSIGAGPQRERAITYTWDGAEFAVRGDIPTTPTFRFQAAEDATTALDVGDLQTAEFLYRRALSDSTLNGLGTPYDEVLTTQALFGILVTVTAQNGIEEANESFMALQNAPLIPSDGGPIPASYAESLWVSAGRTFYEVAQQTEDLSAACEATVTELQANLEDISNYRYYSGNYGYATWSPLPEEACPF